MYVNSASPCCSVLHCSTVTNEFGLAILIGPDAFYGEYFDWLAKFFNREIPGGK